MEFRHEHGISKFSSELNGIYRRYLDAEDNPCSFPCALAKVREGGGGLNAYGLTSLLTDEIGNILEVYGSVFETVVFEISRSVKDKKFFPIPPNYLQLEKVKKVDIEEDNTITEASNKIPVGNSGDGVTVNTKAARIMCNLHGIPTPSYRCAAHSNDGTLKRLTRSKTICIAEAVELYKVCL